MKTASILWIEKEDHMEKRIVAVNAGPRKGWNTDTLIKEAKKERHETVFPEEMKKAYEMGRTLA